jgi:uncharacterized protein YndB with AHSA1/START domain
MPLNKDQSGRRWVEMEFVVPGSPEQVWQAIATGPGIGSWFTPAKVDEQVGGTIEFDFGGDTSSGPVTAWEPPVRFGYEEVGWSGDAPPVATEVTITARSGDECVVRMVHSLFAEKDDWDGELESFEGGWPTFFEILRIYLRHHAGQPAAVVWANATPSGEESQVWKTIIGALGLTGADVGDQWVAPSAVPPLGGVIEQVQQNRRFRQLLLRVSEPAPGVAVIGSCTVAGQVMVNVSVYLYGTEAAGVAEAERPRWATWLSGLFESVPTARTDAWA